MIVIDLILVYPKMLNSVSVSGNNENSFTFIFVLVKCILISIMAKIHTKIAPNSSRPHDVFFKRLRRTSATGDIRFGDGNI